VITHYSDLDILKEKLLEMKQANINQVVYGQIDEKESAKLKGAILAIDTVLELSKKILEEKEKSFKDATGQLLSSYQTAGRVYWEDNIRKD
jgi:hypothetical protein